MTAMRAALWRWSCRASKAVLDVLAKVEFGHFQAQRECHRYSTLLHDELEEYFKLLYQDFDSCNPLELHQENPPFTFCYFSCFYE